MEGSFYTRVGYDIWLRIVVYVGVREFSGSLGQLVV